MQRSTPDTTNNRFTSALVVLVTVCLFVAAAPARALDTDSVGQGVYAKQCASCHGRDGEGVKGEYSKPLVGDKSVAQLAKYIEKWMPEEDPKLCVGDDALHVARFIHESFYSPIAQARRAPVRVELTRLTVSQYRNAVADLVAKEPPLQRDPDKQGLQAQYYKSRDMNRDKSLVYTRIDPQVQFDFGPDFSDRDKFDPKGFSVRWKGSLIAPETGMYDFVVRSDEALKFWINETDDDKPTVWNGGCRASWSAAERIPSCWSSRRIGRASAIPTSAKAISTSSRPSWS